MTRTVTEKNMKLPIYLDYSATCPVDPRVAEKMMQCLTMDGLFGNPASRSHRFGWQAEEAVDLARNQVAELIGADPREIVFTSGATESNNLAIKGVAHFYASKGKHIITSKTEHKAVLDTCRQLEREGFEVTYLEPMPNGLFTLEMIENAMRDDTILVSLMHVNNEIGVIQDIKGLGELCRSRKILLHVDAAQSVGKVEIDVEAMKIDLLSLSAHKIYGPKGIGALYVRRKPRVRLEAQMHGGGHERGMRSGTLPTHQIVGMGEAFRIAKEEMASEGERVMALRQRLWDGLKDIEAVYLNGDLEHRVSGNLNVSFAYVEGESLIMALKDLAVSSGSACTSASLEPSYVLRALGLNDELAHSSIRFSLGRFTTEEEIDYAVKLIRDSIGRLREMSPLWEMYKDGVDLNTVEWAHH
jgi:cysteine desulfurase